MAKTTKKKTMTKKKTYKKPPFDDKAKAGHVTLHVLVGVSHEGSVITYHPSPTDTMAGAISELQENFDFGEHVDVHHFTTVLPFAKAPKVKKARTKKVGTVVRESGATSGISEGHEPEAT